LLLMCDSHGHTPGRSGRGRLLTTVASALLIFGAVALFQFSQRADESNLAGYPDESAHFVTGVCLLDYCKTAFGTNPVAFAESYYAHYPKVAFGHWPPLFYVVEAMWYGVFGVTTLNALLLVGFIGAVAALILFSRLQRLCGASVALFATTVFLWAPVIRKSTLLLLSDMLTGLFMLLAFFAFCDGWILGARRYWIKFGLWTVLAILTKESAASLLVFAFCALLLLAGESLFVRRNLYRMGAGFGLVIAVTLLVYAATGVLRTRDYPQLMTASELWHRLVLVAPFLSGASAAMFLVAGYGTIEVLRSRGRAGSARQIIHVRIALVWLATTVISQLAARTQVEDRYFLAAYFPLAMLFAQGLQSIQCATTRITGRRAAGVLAAAGCAVLSIVSMPGGTSYNRRTGYAEIAANIPSGPLLSPILVSSDAAGEGSFVTERLILENQRNGVVLRASKMLASSDLMGSRKQLRLNSIEQIREFLDTTPVRFVVLDMHGFINPTTRTHHRLLEDTVRGDLTHFRLVGDFPLYLNGHRRAAAVQVYENLGARPNPSGVIRIDMSYSLRRKLEIPLQGGSKASVAPSGSPTLPAWLLRLRPPEATSPTSIRIAPDSDRIDATGGWGRIYVSGPPGRSAPSRELPDWVAISSADSGDGDEVITYRVAENESGKDRWAEIPLGERSFRVTQLRFPYLYLPFVETYSDRDAGPPRGGYSYWPRPSRWSLEDSPGGGTHVTITSDGPQGADSLVIDRHNPPSNDRRATAVYFPGISIHEGAGYRLSLWLKAEHPSQISVRFGQATSPYNHCGLDRLIDTSSSWRKVGVWFRAEGEGCGRDQNRLSIDVGQSTGRLWFSQVFLSRESLQSSSAEQRHGEGYSLDQLPPGEPPGFFQQAVKPFQPGSLHP
jgi:hypothetical protein